MIDKPLSNNQTDGKSFCNTCIFCADLRNPDGSIYCMLHKKNNFIQNPCKDFFDSKSSSMSVSEVLALAKEKRETRQGVIRRRVQDYNKRASVLAAGVGSICFIVGLIIGNMLPRFRLIIQQLINIFR